jgi:hypothetical protein
VIEVKKMQKSNMHHELQQSRTAYSIELKPLRIDVFTSEYCAFCDDALQAAKSAADRLSYFPNKVEVKVTLVDNNPDLIESMNIIALPMIQVGQSRVVGIPSPDDIERLVHESVLNGD